MVKSTNLAKAHREVNKAKKAGTYMGAKKLVSSLQSKGYSKEYAGALAGSISRKKYGAGPTAALSAEARRKK